MHTVALLSVNTGALEPLTPGSKQRSGIRKHPVGGAVLCDRSGLVGDAIGNHKHHGGPDQALYLYSAEDYAWWSKTLQRPCAAGLFGENLTLDAWWDAPRVGDRLRLGDVLLELTAPRIPCATLATHMGDSRFVSHFARAGRCGAYARVLEGGPLAAGFAGTVEPADPSWPTVHELFSLWHETPRRPSALIGALRAPVSARLRTTFLGWAAAT
jgi:MOSC domain-containing protein YiiM